MLEQEGLQADVILDSHANMERYAEAGTVDCIVFNLGRLPGGNRLIFTEAESSILAIDAGLDLLKPRGVMAIALYYGKENGYEEKNAVLQHLKTVDERAYTVLCCEWSNRHAFSALHTYANKAAGALVFAFPVLNAVLGLTAAGVVLCAAALFSSIEELVITINAPVLCRDCRGIFLK